MFVHKTYAKIDFFFCIDEVNISHRSIKGLVTIKFQDIFLIHSGHSRRKKWKKNWSRMKIRT